MEQERLDYAEPDEPPDVMPSLWSVVWFAVALAALPAFSWAVSHYPLASR
jgi:hypothetical protein